MKFLKISKISPIEVFCFGTVARTYIKSMWKRVQSLEIGRDIIESIFKWEMQRLMQILLLSYIWNKNQNLKALQPNLKENQMTVRNCYFLFTFVFMFLCYLNIKQILIGFFFNRLMFSPSSPVINFLQYEAVTGIVATFFRIVGRFR